MPQTRTSIRTASQIRREFIDFFCEKHGHTFAPSSPVVPHDDPTLLFTNAGMNQFKDVFLAQGTRPYTRAANTQKCIRAGGKHNDLEDVGKDTYHHTFFEMLGNWSFGDYFKAEAIAWAWELLVDIWGVDPERLYATYFEGDESQGLEPDTEARELWLRYLPESRVLPGNMKDNFWEMGDTGPCGPCSEIHYDATPDKTGGKLVNAGDPSVIEIWNLVFIQFNRNPGSHGQPGKLVPLPAKHVDTGMGFERITRVLQGKESNYDTDIWTPIFKAIQEKTGARAYSGGLDDTIDIAYRVVADHIRCLTIAITDGATPSNEGRGYVLRRILRRAVRVARQTLGVQGPVLCDLVPAVVSSLGEAFPELKNDPKRIASVIKQEEEAFLKTIDRGINEFNKFAGSAFLRSFVKQQKYIVLLDLDRDVPFFVPHDLHFFEDIHFDGSTRLSISRWQDVGTSKWEGTLAHVDRNVVNRFCAKRPAIAGADAFLLHDTYGFPIDLTCVMAEERGMTVDVEGFEKLMDQARETSRAGGTKEASFTLTPSAIEELKRLNVKPTDDHHKYAHKPVIAKVEAIWNGTDFDNTAQQGRRVAVILDKTNHYAESGGQVGDRGTIEREYQPGFGGSESRPAMRFHVEDTQAVGAPGKGYILHIGRVTECALEMDDEVELIVNHKHRNPTQANHTATHLLNLALREVLGEGIEQKGSLVAPDRLRFDFSHNQAMTIHQVEDVKRIVNEKIEEELTVYAGVVPLNFAKSISGVRAVFGEKYPDPVRVVSVGVPVQDLIAQPDNEQWRQHSIEFCGGTHLTQTGEAQRFVILSEQALAAGVRRIVALTGAAAITANVTAAELMERIESADDLSDEEFVEEVDEIARLMESLTLGAVARHRIQEKLDGLREKAKAMRKRQMRSERDTAVQEARQIAEDNDSLVIVETVFGGDRDLLLAAMDCICDRRPESAVMLGTIDVENAKVLFAARVPKDLIQRGLKAGDWVREAATICGGSGGGKPDSAQAGGKDPAKIGEAIEAARTFAESKLA